MSLLRNIVTISILMVTSIGYATEPVDRQYSLHSVFERYEHQALESTRTGKVARTIIADSIIINGKIYTVNPEQPWAEAVAIRNKKIIRVGSNTEVGVLVGSDTKIYDVDGGFMMPGIIDPHIHPGLLMAKRAYCALPGTFHEPTEEQILDELRKCIDIYPADREWFIAQGFSTPAMSSETLTKEYLDELIPDRPAWIEDESGHNAWFNSKALEMVGIDKSFKDTPEEFFSRTIDGALAGVAYEAAMNPFLDLVNATFDNDLRKTGFMRLLDEASSKGITGGQYFYAFNLKDGWQINASPTFSYNHNASSGNETTFPLGIGASKTTFIGGRPYKFGLQYWHYVESPDNFGPDYQLRFTISPVVKLPW